MPSEPGQSAIVKRHPSPSGRQHSGYPWETGQGSYGGHPQPAYGYQSGARPAEFIPRPPDYDKIERERSNQPGCIQRAAGRTVQAVGTATSRAVQAVGQENLARIGAACVAGGVAYGMSHVAENYPCSIPGRAANVASNAFTNAAMDTLMGPNAWRRAHVNQRRHECPKPE